LIRAQTWYIQIYPNHHFDHNLISENDFEMNPIAAPLYYSTLPSGVTVPFI
jgi:hypothetical protein